MMDYNPYRKTTAEIARGFAWMIAAVVALALLSQVIACDLPVGFEDLFEGGTFDPAGSEWVSKDKRLIFHNNYAVTALSPYTAGYRYGGDKIKFQGQELGCSSPATYRYVPNGVSLEVTALTESCAVRRALVERTWVYDQPLQPNPR
jgi:hypothetical protein